jgi:quinol-cytochrome oxidoreductase complex cytochrome b subunit
MLDDRHKAHEPSGNPLESQPQADPLLKEGRASWVRIVALGIAIVLVVVLTLYGITRDPAPTPATATTPDTGKGAAILVGRSLV